MQVPLVLIFHGRRFQARTAGFLVHGINAPPRSRPDRHQTAGVIVIRRQSLAGSTHLLPLPCLFTSELIKFTLNNTLCWLLRTRMRFACTSTCTYTFAVEALDG